MLANKYERLMTNDQRVALTTNQELQISGHVSPICVNHWKVVGFWMKNDWYGYPFNLESICAGY